MWWYWAWFGNLLNHNIVRVDVVDVCYEYLTKEFLKFENDKVMDIGIFQCDKVMNLAFAMCLICGLM